MKEIKIDRQKTRTQALASDADQDTIFFPSNATTIIMGGKEYADTSKVYNENYGGEWRKMNISTTASNAGWYKVADIVLTEGYTIYSAAKIVGYYYDARSNWNSKEGVRFAFQCVVRFGETYKGAFMYIDPYGNKATDTVRLVKTADRTYELQMGCNTVSRRFTLFYQVMSSTGVSIASEGTYSASKWVTGTIPDDENGATVVTATDTTDFHGIRNVQSDWNATSGDAYIKNKPTRYSTSNTNDFTNDTGFCTPAAVKKAVGKFAPSQDDFFVIKVAPSNGNFSGNGQITITNGKTFAELDAAFAAEKYVRIYFEGGGLSFYGEVAKYNGAYTTHIFYYDDVSMKHILVTIGESGGTYMVIG